MLELKESTILKLADNYVLYNLDISEGMFWLFDIEEGSNFDLNEVSYFELSVIDGKNTYKEVCDKVILKYSDENFETVLKDLNELLDKLYKEGILVESKKK